MKLSQQERIFLALYIHSLSNFTCLHETQIKLNERVLLTFPFHVNIASLFNHLQLGQIKVLLFPEMRVTKKNFIFFNRFSGEILFSSLVSFGFFDSSFYLFVCLILIHILFVCLILIHI